MSAPRLYLASTSPRRRELLRQVGIEPVLLPVAVEERGREGEQPADLVRRLAAAKGRQAAPTLPHGASGLLLAADTEVVLDGACLGKPRGPQEAAAMLRRLRGRGHDVLTGVFLTTPRGDRTRTTLAATRVHFRNVDDASIEAYVASGETADKAGAYGIQGLGALLVDRIEGSWSNVVGLPLERLPVWAAQIGVDLWELIRRGPRPA
jgi:septum formation protein